MKIGDTGRILLSARHRFRSLFVIFLLIALVIVGGSIIATLWTSGTSRSSFDAAEWRQQIETIRHKVSLIESGATLARIFVNPMDEGLRIRMLFVSSKNKYIDVIYQYDHLEDTLYINPDYGNVSIPSDIMSDEERKFRVIALDSTNISPKQVLATTQEVVRGSAQPSKISPFIEAVLELGSEKNKNFDTSSMWVVSYYGEVEKLKLWVNGSNGGILKIDSPYK